MYRMLADSCDITLFLSPWLSWERAQRARFRWLLHLPTSRLAFPSDYQNPQTPPFLTLRAHASILALLPGSSRESPATLPAPDDRERKRLLLRWHLRLPKYLYPYHHSEQNLYQLFFYKRCMQPKRRRQVVCALARASRIGLQTLGPVLQGEETVLSLPTGDGG